MLLSRFHQTACQGIARLAGLFAWLICLVAIAASPAMAEDLDGVAPADGLEVPLEVPREVPLEVREPTPGDHRLSRADVDAWLDGFMRYALNEGGFVGAVVAVVKDGKLLTSRGYGYADLAGKVAMDPASTLVRPGSVSKLFTWTAVMQLVERGELDLDQDINTYLDFTVSGKGGNAITLRHLMTHTAGFEDTVKELMVRRASELPNLEDYAKRALPARVYPPGEVPAYSNYGTALAGYIVQRVSGEPFDAYMQAHIFKPLGMIRSSFRQPLPEALAAAASKGYNNLQDGKPQDYELVTPGPAGALAATANDLARFMIAHLSEGAGLLRPATARKMHSTFDPHIPPLNAMALGFYQENRYGLRIIGHGGDTVYFHSELALFPEHDTGLFVSLNSVGSDAVASLMLREALVTQFGARYFPEGVATPEPSLASAAEHGAEIAGVYESSRASVTNFMALTRYLGQLAVAVGDDGELSMPFLGRPARWREIGPYVWRRVGGSQRMAVARDGGRVQALAFEPASPFMIYTPVPWYRSSALLNPLFALALCVLVGTLLHWLVRALGRYPVPAGAHRAASARAARTGVLLVVVYLVAWGWLFATLLADLSGINSSFDLPIRILQGAQFALYAVLAITLWNAVVYWRQGRGWVARCWSLSLPLAVAIVIWLAWATGLLGFDINY